MNAADILKKEGLSDPKTGLNDVVCQLLAGSPGGLTAPELKRIFKHELKRWKPTSVSPTISQLLTTGCARAEMDANGERRVFFVRQFDKKARDMLTARAHERDARLHGIKRGGSKKRQNTKAIALGSNGPVKMLFAFGENKTEVMTLDEARAMYEQLHAIFGKQ